MSNGGAQRVVSVLANRFSKSGHSVEILVLYENNDIAYQLNRNIPVVLPSTWGENTKKSLINRIDYLKYKIKRKLNSKKETEYEILYNYEIIGNGLVKYLKHYQFEIVYSFLTESNIAIGLRRKKIKSKIIMAERNFPNKPMDLYVKALRDKCYKRCNKLVCQTKSQALCFDKTIQKNAVIINNPIKSDLPERFTGARRKVIVNYCGFKTHKNIPLLLKACKQIFKKHPDYSLELYGYGDVENIKNLVEELKISDKVKFAPFCTDIHEKVKDAAMFVMTSDYEGMPNALAEAMAIGIPVISTDCAGGGAKELINNGENGLLVPIGDVNAVAESMMYYIDHPDIAESFALKALEIKERLSIDKIAKSWLDLI